MASNKTQSVKKKVAPKAKASASTKGGAKTPVKTKAKAAPRAPAVPQKVLPRHPKARVADAHGSKAALAKAIAVMIARADQDTDLLESELKTASNAQLLRLSEATKTLKEKFGDRGKLIAAIGAASNKSKDKDYLAKLETYSLPRLLDLAAASQRAART
ncbi:MAG TPA: hypothetical protein VFT22_35060 [Kofleriaceae bacterium]|nr:hypothetical protein [Kofleriaceae bacterium]